jgi:hypothetical protein
LFPADFAEWVRLDIRMILGYAVLDGLTLSNTKPNALCVNLQETNLWETHQVYTDSVCRL